MTQNEIIQKIKDGGQAELGLVYETYRKEFLHWLVKDYHCSSDDSQDIYQLTILVFHDNIKNGKLENLVSSVKTYLFGIGKNIAMDFGRKAKRNSPIDKERWLTDYLMDESDNAPTDQMFDYARKALENLGEPCRQLIKLFYYGKKTMEEITSVLNYKNAETAKNQKCKCMKRLRKLYESEQSKTLIDTSYEQ
jgi:RNA polymerase sigma-70 factor (ECF subfamily)